jgi:superfamily II DNA or RNA helicase
VASIEDTLREYQREAIKKIRKSLKGGARRIMLVLATGGGKTVIASAMIENAVAKDKRVLFGAHRREILNQTYNKLVHFGLPKEKLGVIMAKDPRRNPVAHVQIASVDTLRNRTKPPADLVFVDECLVAGTKVDGIPIEHIKIGDFVNSRNDALGLVERRQVTHVFRSKPSSILTVHLTDGTSVTCTHGHPFFTNRGYVEAANLTTIDVCIRLTNEPRHDTEDVRCLLDSLYAEVMEQHHDSDLLAGLSKVSSRGPQEGRHRNMQALRKTDDCQRARVMESADGYILLLEEVRGRSPSPRQGRGASSNEPQARIEAHEGEQSDAQFRYESEGIVFAEDHGLEAASTQGQRNRTYGAARGARKRSWLEDGGFDSYQAAEVYVWLSSGLQGGHRLGGVEDSDRGRRQQPLLPRSTGAGSKEGIVPIFVGVDRVEVHEQTSDGTFGGVCPDGHVYNLEVEGNHNYFANSILTHNCHRSLAKTYERILECYPSVPIIGMTASPWRADNKGFDQAYDDIVVVCTVADLISQGWLVKPTCYTIPDDQQADLSEVHMSGSDFNERDLAAALNKRHLVGNIVEHWERKADGRRTVVFAASVEHSKSIVAAFVEAGHKAEHLDGEMDTVLRDAILARLDSGETLIVSSCGILSEGWDQPSVKCAILARPTMSLALCIQQVGRILRPWQGVEALILDHAGNILRHGLPDEDREYTLEATKKKKGAAGGMKTKTCPMCYAMHPISLSVCPCGHEFTVQRGDPETVEGTLVEYTLEDKKAEWKRLTDIEAERGTPGWAFEMFKQKYKRAPPKEFRPISVPVHTERDKTSYCRWLMNRARQEGRSMHWVRAVFRGKFAEEAPLEILREGRRS